MTTTFEVPEYKDMSREELIETLEAHDAHHQEHHEKEELMQKIHPITLQDMMLVTVWIAMLIVIVVTTICFNKVQTMEKGLDAAIAATLQ